MTELLKAIQAVSNDIRNIEKNLTVGNGNNSYKAVGDVDVVLAVKDAEKKHGIISIPIKQEATSEVLKVVGSSGETLKYHDTVKMTVRIYLIADPTKYIDIESYGRGLDSGDKGFGKASTYARKYALLNAYKIATGEDPDADKSKEDISATIDEKKVAVFNYLNDNPTYASEIAGYFKVQSYAELTEKQITQIYNDNKKKGRI